VSSADQPGESAGRPAHRGGSRQPLSNRAGPENDSLSASHVPMAKRDGMELRDELTFDTSRAVKAVTWGEAVDRFQSWYDDQRGTQIVVENELGETVGFETPNRFTPEYREMLYAKAQSLERGLRERWGKLLHTAMVTLTASSTDEDGRPRPPLEHFEDLLESWEAVRRALARVLDGRDWEYLAILEPHESGYVHIHLGVFVKGPVVAEQFEPVLDAHLRNCPTAGEDAHQVFDEDGDEDAVRVRRSSHPSRQNGVENLGAYLAAYMAGEYGSEPSEMPENVRGFYATMWASGRQWFRPSNGAQELMQPDDDEEDVEEWEMVGIAPDGDLGDVVEVDPEAPRRRLYRTLSAPPPAD
jgi:hypothetical protein